MIQQNFYNQQKIINFLDFDIIIIFASNKPKIICENLIDIFIDEEELFSK